MVIKASSSEDEEDEASKCSSSDKKEEMSPELLKQAKIMKKINMIGYTVFLKDRHHHQLIKVERIKYKKKKQNKKENKPKP